MPKLRFPCEVKGGKLILTHDVPDGVYYVEFKPTGVRSPAQNNYYWFIVEMLSETLGYSVREMHEVLKEYFNIPSTKNLTVEEFQAFLDELIIWASTEFNVVIPDPTRSL